MPPLTLRAAWVVPLDGPPIQDGMVVVDNGLVRAVGQRIEPHGPIETFPDCVLLPGLVNAHAHLEFSGLASPLGTPNAPLTDWIREVIAWRTRRQRDLQPAIQAGLRESLAAGVTTIAEIATAPAAAYVGEPSPRLVMLHEVIGFSQARVESVASDLEQRLAADAPPATMATGISPHAPYTVHPELLERLVVAAAEQRRPVAMHLAESLAELELLAHGTGPFQQLLDERSMWDARAIPAGSTPADYLRVLRRAPRSLVVHGNYLGDTEIELLARASTMSVVFCPRTHAYFGHRRYQLAQWLAAGVRVVIGTDGRASSPDLSLLAELQWVARHYPEIAAEKVVRMGTKDGARALGLDETLGSITPGKLADLVAVATSDLSGGPYRAVLEPQARAAATWLGGARVA